VPETSLFFQAASANRTSAEAALAAIAENWKDAYAAMVVDIIRLIRVPGPHSEARAYEVGGNVEFRRLDDQRVKDGRDRTWRIAEHAFVCGDSSLPSLPRIPSHRAFWFGCFAQHPDTELIRQSALRRPEPHCRTGSTAGPELGADRARRKVDGGNVQVQASRHQVFSIAFRQHPGAGHGAEPGG